LLTNPKHTHTTHTQHTHKHTHKHTNTHTHTHTRHARADDGNARAREAACMHKHVIQMACDRGGEPLVEDVGLKGSEGHEFESSHGEVLSVLGRGPVIANANVHAAEQRTDP
jgi:hypothetical protein